jgi:hypothetical protein
LIVLAGALPLLASELLVGVATVDITPPIPYRMCGYFDERLSTGVKDRLQAKAMVFRQGNEQAALVFCDVAGLPRELTNGARHQASCATGIPVNHIAIAATHSHTGPLFSGVLRNYFHQRAVARLGSDPYEKIDYPSELLRKVVEAIVDAHLTLKPAVLKSGYAREDRLSFNRRFHMRDGSVRFNPGALNPDVVRPAGPIDPQVAIVSVAPSSDSPPAAALLSFALHLDTVGGTEYSADFPKVTEDTLRESFGSDFNLVFGIGTCGDVNHVDVNVPERRPSNEIGKMLGTTVADAIRRGKLIEINEPSLAARSAVVEAPLQTYSDSEAATARQQMELLGSQQLGFLDQVQAYKIMVLEDYGVQTLPLEVQAIRLGREIAIVTLPGEIFVELGLAVKAASPFEMTIVIEMPDDSLGYVPTRKAFAEGSYEIVNSRVEPGVGERLVEAAITLLEDLNEDSTDPE